MEWWYKSEKFKVNNENSDLLEDGMIDTVTTTLNFGLGGIHIRFADLMFNGEEFQDGLWDLVGEIVTELVNEQLLGPIGDSVEGILNVVLKGILEVKSSINTICLTSEADMYG